MPGARTAPKEESKQGTIEYVDKGDYTQEIDRRLPEPQYRMLPKSQRDTVTDPKVHEELKSRIEAENELRKQEAEQAAAPLVVPELREEYDPDTEDEVVVVSVEGGEKPASADTSKAT
jgi:hypothetical protein